MRILKRRNIFCSYGCGELASHKFMNGKYCCNHHSNKCLVNRKINSEARKGKCLGDDNPAKRPEVGRKISEAKKGFKHTDKSIKQMRESQRKHFASDKGKKQAKRHSERMSGENHHNYGKKRPEHSKFMSGENNPMKRPEVAAKCGLKGELNPAKRPEVRESISKTQIQRYLDGKVKLSGLGKSGYFFSKKNNKYLHYRSSYELVAYKMLEQMSKVKSYETEPFGIQYEYQNSIHRTIPDLLITYTDETKELIEVKPEYKLVDEQTISKLDAMENYALKNGWDFNVWTEKQLNLN